MRKIFLAVLMVAMLATPCFAQIKPSDNVYFTALWEYSCLPPTEDFAPLFEDILNGGIGFNLKGVFQAFWGNEKCRFVVNHQSDVVFEIVNFMPIIFFEFEERYGEQLVNAIWSYSYKGVVFPLLNVGFLYIWMDASNALQFDEVLSCFMTRKSDTRNFGFCTSYWWD